MQFIIIWCSKPRDGITANSIISDSVGQTTNLGYQNASKESKEHAHTKILVYGCLEAFQNGCQKFVMTSSKIYNKFKSEIKYEKLGSKLTHTFIYENVTNMFFLKNGPFRLLRAPIDVE